jgi:tetratricopeptide (TPR) repeat protein
MNIKSKLIELIERASELIRDLESSISEEECRLVGTYERWEIKDHIAHCAAWNERLTKNISTALQGITPVTEEDYERVNAEIYNKHRDQSWEEIVAYSEAAYHELIEVVNSISEVNLSEGELLPWQNGRELWKLIIGTSYTHPLSYHVCPLYIEKGNSTLALEIQEEMTKGLGVLDDSPSWVGVNKYNLACFYSLSGYKDRAIQGLKEALHLNPELEDWSKQDPDFDAIRGEAEYLALYEDN